jgi:hypothetical protein
MSHRELERDVEKILRKRLRRIEAPSELWAQVQSGEHLSARTSPTWIPWASTVAAVVAVVGGWTLWQGKQAPLSTEALAVAALKDGGAHLELRTDEPDEVRRWVRAQSGIEIPLPPVHDPTVRIMGANIIQGAVPVAEISYRVGEDTATLLVAKDPTGARSLPGHEAREAESYKSARVSSWSMRGQAYTLASASSGEFKSACLLCHTDSEPPLL